MWNIDFSMLFKAGLVVGAIAAVAIAGIAVGVFFLIRSLV